MRRASVLFAVVGLVAAVASAVIAITLRIVDPAPMIPSTFGFSDAALVGFACFGIAFAGIGALLVVRRPWNTVGWLMVVGGVAHAAAGMGGAIASSLLAVDTVQGDAFAAVVAWLTLFCVSAGACVLVLAILFPTGRGHTRAWDRMAWLYLAGLAAIGTIVLTQPGPLNTFPTIENPFPIGPELQLGGAPLSRVVVSASVLLAPVFAWAIASRYRASDAVVRRQLKWFVLSMVVALFGLAVAFLAPLVTEEPPPIALAVFGFGGTLVAMAIGIAILRYRLYDIDRLISRTLSYGLVTGVLAAVFTGSVVALSALPGSLTDGDSLAVALSTLLVAVLFGPLRRRAQAAIDRRFDRARFDTERTTQAFAVRLRSETDIDRVTYDLNATVQASLHPSGIGVWLR
jgi:hypothetical protein